MCNVHLVHLHPSALLCTYWGEAGDAEGDVKGVRFMNTLHKGRQYGTMAARAKGLCKPISLIKLTMSVILKLISVAYKQQGEYAEGW